MRLTGEIFAGYRSAASWSHPCLRDKRDAPAKHAPGAGAPEVAHIHEYPKEMSPRFITR